MPGHNQYIFSCFLIRFLAFAVAARAHLHIRQRIGWRLLPDAGFAGPAGEVYLGNMDYLLAGPSEDWRVVLSSTGKRSNFRKLPSLLILVLASILAHFVLQLGFGT